MNDIRHCQVMGPFSTGTVLMNGYVHRLFRAFRPECFKYWKHSLPPWFWENDRPHNDAQVIPAGSGQGFPGIFFVCMVRSPYFWLPATCRRPYNFRFRVSGLDISERLRSPVELKGRLFANLAQAWNSYYRGYAQHLEPLGRVVYVRLEDLVQNPHDTVRRLEARLERRPDSDVSSTIESLAAVPSKSDNSFGQDWEAKNRLESARQNLPQADLSFINQQLDPQLMKKFGYSWAWVSPQSE